MGQYCQGGYATKRYRSNLINWGMIPFLYPEDELPFANDDYLFVPDIKSAIKNKLTRYKGLRGEQGDERNHIKTWRADR